MFYPPVFLNKRRGFTIIEVLLSALIGSAIVGCLFYVLNSGNIINDLSSAKVSSQSQARRVSDWITRDLRQAQLGNLAPFVSHTSIKFNPVLGVNLSDGTYQLDYSKYIEYVYDENAQTLTRNILDQTGGVLQSWVFVDVLEAPFFTRDASGNLIDLDNSVLTTRNVVSIITVAKTSGRGVVLTASLTAETKIRNE